MPVYRESGSTIYATAMQRWRLEQGENLKVVQELLGHRGAAFTLQVYGHLTPGLHEQSAKTLEARLLKQKPSTSV
jgi:site-specific recombinase XerD